ncbi:hypothetical protein ACSAZL_13550 [Methanosarcina sp. T3]|uniref:hypothetical protein n=1 Tax=Methanosarcina sp. T3 TaxID=3439062 RepID=UPI003F874073
MRYSDSLSILLTLLLLFLTSNLAAASFSSEAAEIPYQINVSDRIIIGTVSGFQEYYDHTIFTITVEEWLYNPLSAKTINVRTESGTNVGTSIDAQFVQNESVLLMLNDVNLDQQLFRVAIGGPGKHPVSDRDAVIKELKAQSKWHEENQTADKTNDTKVTENAGTVGEQEEKSNITQESKSTPFISPVLMLAAVLGAVTYARKK